MNYFSKNNEIATGTINLLVLIRPFTIFKAVNKKIKIFLLRFGPILRRSSVVAVTNTIY